MKLCVDCTVFSTNLKKRRNSCRQNFCSELLNKNLYNMEMWNFAALLYHVFFAKDQFYMLSYFPMLYEVAFVLSIA
jgi:hypothetical protein